MGKKKHHHKDTFEIIYKDCGTGRSKVSLVRRKSDGKLLIWKRSRSSTNKRIDSYKKEIKKTKFWKKIGITKSKAWWCYDKKSLLKTYVRGETLKKILRENPHFFSEGNSEAAKALIKFIDLLVDSNHYIHDMKGTNIIFDGSKWQAIDGGMAYKMSRSSVKKEYRKNLLEKWSREIDSQEEINALKLFLERYI